VPRYHSKPIKPSNPTMMRLSVHHAERISAGFMRVTLTGDDLGRFAPMGDDQWFRLFLPQEHQSEPVLPTATDARWWPQVLITPADKRPHVRNYTVRAYREDERELDVDFVIHSPHGADAVAGSHGDAAAGGSEGPASAWALAAKRGAKVGVLDEGVMWNPHPRGERVLIVADDSGVPGAAGIAAGLRDDAVGTMVLEVAGDGDRREFRHPDGVEVRWVVRDQADGTSAARKAPIGAGALAAATELADRGISPDCAVWVVGEHKLATGTRRALVARGMPKEAITFCGYWKQGRDNSL